MYCGKCGHKIENPNAHFCPKCGAQLPKIAAPAAQPQADATAPPPQTPSATAQIPVPPRPVPSAEAQPPIQPAPAKKHRLPVVLLILLLLVVAGAAAWFLLGMDVDKVKTMLPFLSKESTQASVDLPEVDEPLLPATAETSEQAVAATATPQPTATPLPTATPAPEKAVASDTQTVLRGIPEDASITANGIGIPFTLVGKDAVIDSSLLPVPCQLRVTAQKDDGIYSSAVCFFTEDSSNDLDFSTLSWQDSTSDGFSTPTAGTMLSLATDYYEGFLKAINAQSLDPLVYSTADNTADQSEHVFSDLNNQSVWDTETFTCQIDESSLTTNNDIALFNVTYSAYRTRDEDGETVSNTNHRTIRARWDGSMWKVDAIAFLSDADFAAHKYADFK